MENNYEAMLSIKKQDILTSIIESIDKSMPAYKLIAAVINRKIEKILSNTDLPHFVSDIKVKIFLACLDHLYDLYEEQIPKAKQAAEARLANKGSAVKYLEYCYHKEAKILDEIKKSIAGLIGDVLDGYYELTVLQAFRDGNYIARMPHTPDTHESTSLLKKLVTSISRHQDKILDTTPSPDILSTIKAMNLIYWTPESKNHALTKSGQEFFKVFRDLYRQAGMNGWPHAVKSSTGHSLSAEELQKNLLNESFNDQFFYPQRLSHRPKKEEMFYYLSLDIKEKKQLLASYVHGALMKKSMDATEIALNSLLPREFRQIVYGYLITGFYMYETALTANSPRGDDKRNRLPSKLQLALINAEVNELLGHKVKDQVQAIDLATSNSSIAEVPPSVSLQTPEIFLHHIIKIDVMAKMILFFNGLADVLNMRELNAYYHVKIDAIFKRELQEIAGLLKRFNASEIREQCYTHEIFAIFVLRRPHEFALSMADSFRIALCHKLVTEKMLRTLDIQLTVAELLNVLKLKPLDNDRLKYFAKIGALIGKHLPEENSDILKTAMQGISSIALLAYFNEQLPEKILIDLAFNSPNALEQALSEPVVKQALQESKDNWGSYHNRRTPPQPVARQQVIDFFNHWQESLPHFPNAFDFIIDHPQLTKWDQFNMAVENSAVALQYLNTKNLVFSKPYSISDDDLKLFSDHEKGKYGIYRLYYLIENDPVIAVRVAEDAYWRAQIPKRPQWSEGNNFAWNKIIIKNTEVAKLAFEFANKGDDCLGVDELSCAELLELVKAGFARELVNKCLQNAQWLNMRFSPEQVKAIQHLSRNPDKNQQENKGKKSSTLDLEAKKGIKTKAPIISGGQSSRHNVARVNLGTMLTSNPSSSSYISNLLLGKGNISAPKTTPIKNLASLSLPASGAISPPPNTALSADPAQREDALKNKINQPLNQDGPGTFNASLAVELPSPKETITTPSTLGQNPNTWFHPSHLPEDKSAVPARDTALTTTRLVFNKTAGKHVLQAMRHSHEPGVLLLPHAKESNTLHLIFNHPEKGLSKYNLTYLADDATGHWVPWVGRSGSYYPMETKRSNMQLESAQANLWQFLAEQLPILARQCHFTTMPCVIIPTDLNEGLTEPAAVMQSMPEEPHMDKRGI